MYFATAGTEVRAGLERSVGRPSTMKGAWVGRVIGEGETMWKRWRFDIPGVDEGL